MLSPDFEGLVNVIWDIILVLSSLALLVFLRRVLPYLLMLKSRTSKVRFSIKILPYLSSILLVLAGSIYKHVHPGAYIIEDRMVTFVICYFFHGGNVASVISLLKFSRNQRQMEKRLRVNLNQMNNRLLGAQYLLSVAALFLFLISPRNADRCLYFKVGSSLISICGVIYIMQVHIFLTRALRDMEKVNAFRLGKISSIKVNKRMNTIRQIRNLSFGSYGMASILHLVIVFHVSYVQVLFPASVILCLIAGGIVSVLTKQSSNKGNRSKVASAQIETNSNGESEYVN